MYTIDCPSCGANLRWTGSQCLACGHIVLSEQGCDLEVSDGVTIEPDEPQELLPACPKCSSLFNGWDCELCGFSALPEKDPKMHPKVVLLDEAEECSKESDRELDFD